MWSMKITVLNMKTLQEYRIQHDRVLDQDDVVLTYNAVNHFNATGEWSGAWLSYIFCLSGLVKWLINVFHLYS